MRPDSTGRIQAAKSQEQTENELAFVYKEINLRASVSVVKKIKLNKQILVFSFCCWKYIWGNSRRCVLAGKKDNYHTFERNFYFYLIFLTSHGSWGKLDGFEIKAKGHCKRRVLYLFFPFPFLPAIYVCRQPTTQSYRINDGQQNEHAFAIAKTKGEKYRKQAKP